MGFLSESVPKIKCLGTNLEKLYHFKVPKKGEIGEKCPKVYRFQVENRACRGLSFCFIGKKSLWTKQDRVAMHTARPYPTEDVVYRVHFGNGGKLLIWSIFCNCQVLLKSSSHFSLSAKGKIQKAFHTSAQALDDSTEMFIHSHAASYAVTIGNSTDWGRTEHCMVPDALIWCERSTWNRITRSAPVTNNSLLLGDHLITWHKFKWNFEWREVIVSDRKQRSWWDQCTGRTAQSIADLQRQGRLCREAAIFKHQLYRQNPCR